jgi:hypothetical protein
MKIPTSPDELSADWLAAALAGVLADARIASAEVVDWNAGTTGRARLRIAYGGGGDGPASLFVKLPPADPMQKLMVQATGMGRREVLFYSRLAAEVPVRCPRPYFAAASEDGSAYLMLLEDLAAGGCEFPSLFGGCAADYARPVVAELARLHARYWDSPRFADELAWVEPPMRHEIGPRLVGAALDEHGEQMPEVFRRMARLYIERTDEICDLWEEGVPTLCHGDCHIGNHFVDGGVPGFLDWACVYRCPGTRDVSYFLANSVPAELRRAEERDLLERYRATLEQAGVAPPSFETLWRQHCRHVAYSWVAAVTTFAMGDRWQALRHGREAVRRANDALADLETVDVIAEDLG